MSARTIRQLVLLTAEENAAIEEYWHAQRFSSRSEAVRHLITASLALDVPEPEPVNTTPPTIPEPHECGRPLLGELVLPWLRKQGLRSYAVADVVAGVFTVSTQPGHTPAVVNIFKAIGWKPVQVRDGRTVTTTYHAPDGAL